MEKYIYNEQNGLWYELQGDYYIPCLTIPKEEQQPIGMWGRRHLRYIREYRKGLYDSLDVYKRQPLFYFLGIAAVIISGIILKKTKMFAGDPAPFVMELPQYLSLIHI